MMEWTDPILPLAALGWPLLLAVLAVLPALRRHAVRLLPLSPLPALWLALAGSDMQSSAPDLLLGVTLGLDPARRLLLGMTAALWCLAALAAQPMAGRPGAAMFAGFWGLTLAGNLGVFLARDVATFYVAFAAVSLASWFLIVHARDRAALRAGRVYIAMALAGEVALLVGLILGADAAGSTAIAEMPAALAQPGAGTAACVLLIAGFGIKAGLVPLHVWLPLAHPAAPAAASAVLSGAIVKAGLIGMLLFLPEGVFAEALLALGLAGAFGAALWGLTQTDPKAVLAYSTISQMGLMIALLAAGGAAREAVPLFALHHGFAKGGLFLLTGAMKQATSRGQRLACLIAAAVLCASVAGVPLTGGALAKAAVKPGLPGALVTVLSLSSVATSLILLHFLARLRALPTGRPATGWPWRLAPPLLAGLPGLVLPWLLWSGWTGKAVEDLLTAGAMRDALWPVLAALPLALLLRRGVPTFPPGDLLLLVPSLPPRAGPRPAPLPRPRRLEAAAEALPGLVARAETILTRWRFAGRILPLLVLLFFAVIA
ncbi:MAG: proton-conducting transporter membrane subunit [Paracoccaceae bacterium]